MPVIDVTAIAKDIENHLETVAKWKIQYKQMVMQIDQMKQEYKSLTGSRGLGDILDDPRLRDYLPSNWQSVYDSMKTLGYASLRGRAKSIFEDNKIHDICANLGDSQERIHCEAQAVKAAQDKAFTVEAYDKSQLRLEQIDKLMAKINDTHDPKAISELQGRIAIEQTKIQNQKTQLQLYAIVAATEDRLQQQQQEEINVKNFENSKFMKHEPFNLLE